MKRIPLTLLASAFLCACALAADEPKGTLNFKNAELQQVLPNYKALSGLDLVVDSRVKIVRWPVTLQSSEPLSKAEAMKLIEKALLEQAGVVITRLDGQRASVTYNDALAITPAKK
jgi:type II secretory pathway component GspD/PulD (secretin)